MTAGIRVTVVGDALLDRDIEGTAVRLSPEAPVPVLEDLRQRDRPGGAALAAALAARSGARTALVTGIGADEAGDQLRAVLAAHGVDVVDVGLAGGTPEKVRVCAGGRPLVRMDRGSPAHDGGAGRPAPAVRDAVHAAVCAADAVLVADYGRGLTGAPWLRRAVSRRAADVPVVWDPHPRGSAPVEGCALVTPNRAEAAAFLGDAVAGDRAVAARQAAALRGGWRAGAVLVTLGAEGGVLAGGDGLPVTLPARPVSGDPCGAGDAVAAAAACALGRGVPVQRAAMLAVEAATAYVAGGGAAALHPLDLRPAEGSGAAEALAAQVRERGGRVVATGGCFDLLHTGHLSVLEAARRLGDCLIVCLNSDASVRRLKGSNRPLVSEEDRAAVLRAVRWVDAVALFDESTPDAVLRRLRPHAWVKGSDYSAGDLPEREVLAEWGGEAVIVPYRSGRSTTRLLALARRSA